MNCGCYGFRLNGRDKVTMYTNNSHKNMANIVLSFVKKYNTDEMEYIVNGIRMVKAEDSPYESQIDDCVNLGAKLDSTWLGLLEFAENDLSIYSKGLKYMLDNRDLLYDANSCQWAYIVNLDNEVVEVYQGAGAESSRGRYFESSNNSWPGVTLVKTIPFKVVKEC